jgi:hypothetical protein
VERVSSFYVWKQAMTPRPRRLSVALPSLHNAVRLFLALAACVRAVLPASAQRLAAGQSRESAQRWVGKNYPADLDRVLPLGEWTSDRATKPAEWRVAFRARGGGPEWLQTNVQFVAKAGAACPTTLNN